MFDTSVLGYLDPGTGSIIIQVFVAAFLTAGVVCRRYLSMPFAWLYRAARGRATLRATIRVIVGPGP